MSNAKSPGREVALRARCVAPIDQPALDNAAVVIADGQIVALERQPPADAIDLGDAVLLPGFVNAHTHLEFSDLAAPLGYAGVDFPRWIETVIEHRRRRPDGNEEASTLPAVQAGAREALQSGTTTLGEIATTTWPPPGLAPPLRMVVFRELLGLAAERQKELLDLARAHLEAAPSFPPDCLPGLSPHAPYTAPLSLVESACELSAQHKAPLAMHLAESWEEMELLASGSGALVELLSELGAWRPGAIPRGLRPRDYLERLRRAPRAVVVHGTFLTEEDWQLLAAARGHMSVAHCPRTHDHFGRGRYPLAEMLAAGVRVALGTDSRASNPDLSLLAEAKRVAQRHADVSPETILRMATLDGAAALGLEEQVGSLTPGKAADLVAIRLPRQGGGDPCELLFDEASEVAAVWTRGRLAFEKA